MIGQETCLNSVLTNCAQCQIRYRRFTSLGIDFGNRFLRFLAVDDESGAVQRVQDVDTRGNISVA